MNLVTLDILDQAAHYAQYDCNLKIVDLFRHYSEDDWKSCSTQEQWEIHMYGLYYYIDALLYSTQEKEAEDALYSLYISLMESGEHRFSYNRQFAIYKDWLQAHLLLLKKDGNPKRIMSLLGHWIYESSGSKSNTLSEEERYPFYYGMIAVNLKEGNIIDAKSKLNELSELSSLPFCWQRRFLEIQQQIKAYQYTSQSQKNTSKVLFEEIADSDECQVISIAIHPDHITLAVLYSNGKLKLYDRVSGTELAVNSDNCANFHNEIYYNGQLVFTPDGQFVVLGLGIGVVQFYKTPTLEWVRTLNYPGLNWEQLDQNAYYEEYTYIKFSPSGNQMIVLPTAEYYDPQGDIGYQIPEPYGTFHILYSQSSELLLTHYYRDKKINFVAFNEKEDLLAVGILGDRMDIWNIRTKKIILSRDDLVWIGLADQISEVRIITFLKNSNKLAYASKDGSIRIVDLNGNEPDQKIDLPVSGTIHALESDMKGKIIAAISLSSKNSAIYQYSIESYSIRCLCHMEDSYVKKVIIPSSTNHLWIVWTSRVELREYSTGTLLRVWDAHAWNYQYSVITCPSAIDVSAGLVVMGYQDRIRIGKIEQASLNN